MLASGSQSRLLLRDGTLLTLYSVTKRRRLASTTLAGVKEAVWTEDASLVGLRAGRQVWVCDPSLRVVTGWRGRGKVRSLAWYCTSPGPGVLGPRESRG